MAELPFDSEAIEELVVRMNAVAAKEGEEIPSPGGNPADDALPEVLQEHPGDLSRAEIIREIETLHADQQHALVALLWIGRGDAEAAEWEETLERARRHETGRVSRYLLRDPLAGAHLRAGLDQLRANGIID